MVSEKSEEARESRDFLRRIRSETDFVISVTAVAEGKWWAGALPVALNTKPGCFQPGQPVFCGGKEVLMNLLKMIFKIICKVKFKIVRKKG